MVLRNWLSTVTQPRSGIPAAIRQKIQHDPYYRLQSIAEVQLAASLGIQIDVNQATVDDWLRLPGLSIHQARSLVELSRAGVPFHCVDDLAAALSLPISYLKPLEPILRFCYYDPDSVCAVQPINPNTASVEMLVRIPGVDLYLAKAIVQHRKQGAYRNLSHLQRRLALPGQLTAELMHYLRF
ncbi:helix-hairpin-helix domain-containing protein [Pantanalinema rosaneae CENA516]|uniref:helix-hairpin-helix domain-containing protein n=1 Tax=Pantanalinema rosaneae TaxID=1620701 RepID=UPI003D6F1838